jgi:hypothetical protein
VYGSLRCRQIERKFYKGCDSDSDTDESFMSLLDFQKNNLRSQSMATVGNMLVGQLRQVPGVSVSAAEAIAEKLGGTMALLGRTLHGMSPGGAQVRV